MKKLILTATLFLLLVSAKVNSQSLSVNSDGSIANASAMLDVKSTVKGLLIPRMSRTERNAISSPATGLLIFQNAPDSVGFYYYNGSVWTWILANSNADSLAWRTRGNTGTSDANNFIGTVDNVPFNIRVNNQKSGRIDHITWNSFYGYQSGNAVTSGIHNTAMGYQTLLNNSSGSNNVATGLYAMNQNTTAGRNVAVGSNALFTQSFSNGNTAWNSENIAIGDSVLYSNQPTTTLNGYQNTAVGNRSLRTNTTGYQNAALGTLSLFNNTIGQLNTATGWASLYKNNDGFYNTAVGGMAMYYNTTGGYNVGVGAVSLHNNLTGVGNTAVGQQAGLGTFGNSFSYNTIIGYQSGYNLTTGSNNVFLGNQAGFNVTSASNKLYIANTAGSNPLVFGDFSTGYVGIGTTSPSAKFHVGAGTRFTVLDTGSIFLQSGNTIGSARDWKIAVTLPNGYLTFRDMGYDNQRTDAMTTDAMVIAWGTGNVGIGTSAPTSRLEVNGYTKLGTGGTVPAVQMKKLTGTSASSAGAIVAIAHGLNSTKILAVDVLLDNGSSIIPPRYDNPAVDYSFHITSTDIVIYNGAFMTVFSRPVKILITYEQ